MKRTFIAGTLITACCAKCVFGQLAFYDPTGASTLDISAPTGVVDVNVFPEKHLVRIPRQFYGVNCHTGPAFIHFKNPEVIKALNLDMIRIMVNRRTWWDEGKRIDRYLSPKRGHFEWEHLDGLINAIKAADAEPYVSLGFGAPPWLNGGEGKRFPRPSREQIPEFSGYLATVVKHLNVDKHYNIKWFSIENEPENVEYPLEDYVYLATNAMAAIKAVDGSVQLTGPVTGYASWLQADGSSLTFEQSLRKLHDSGVGFDGIDWHMYSHSPDAICETALIIKDVYGEDMPMILSELNLDWRYTASKGGEQSRVSNTSWESTLWLSRLYDLLQQDGVDKTFYFCLSNDVFGFLDYRQNEVRPNYYTLWLMTNLLGRDRVAATTSHPAIGVIATKDKRTLFLYNLADVDVDVNIAFPETNFSLDQHFIYTKSWYEQNKAIEGDSVVFPSLKPCGNSQHITLPPLGIALVTYKTPQGFRSAGAARK